MSAFQIRDGQFWLNGEPTVIQAGEFHYFRTPADQWAHRLGLLQTAGFSAVAAYIPWLWHQPQPDLTDLDGCTHPMRNLAGFLDLAAEMGLYIIARPGPYIMAETINEGIPPWVFSQRPQAALVGQDGKAQNIASYLHPDFLECVEGWYRAVFQVLAPRQVTRGGKILMIQLDNEMGMIQWLRSLLDINPDTLDRFADWLRATYGARLMERYPSVGLADFLRQRIVQPQMPDGAVLVEDYRRFYRAYLRDYAAHLWQRAAAHGMEVQPVVNVHGFGNGGKTFPIGLSQLVDVMSLDGMISAIDMYPLHIDEGNFHQLLLVNEMSKALHNPQQALFSIEFQAGGNQDFSGAQTSLYDLHSRLCVSCGMRALNHYLFFDGENDPLLSPVKRHDWGHPVRKDGTLRRHYAHYARLSRVLKSYGADLALARPQTVASIGFLLDHFMTEVNNVFTRPAADILTHQREIILFDFLARGLAITHRPFDALELARDQLHPAHTPILWVMMEKQCDAAVQQRLVDYVHQGGRLILVGRMCEETFDHAPCAILRDALGIDILHSAPPFAAATIHAFDSRDIPVSFLETYSGAFDEIFARSADGETVGFIRRIGAGQVMMLGAAFAANTLDDLSVLDQMAQRIGCNRAFTLTEWADVRLSRGENGDFLFVNNYQDDPIETIIASAERPLLGGHGLLLPARRGVILPLEWRMKPGIVIHYANSEIIEVIEDSARLTLKTAAAECFAEVSVSGWQPDASLIVERLGGARLKLHIRQGAIELKQS